MLFIAVVLGGATFYLTQTYLKNKEKELQNSYQPEKAETKRIIVAIGDIKKGDILKGPMVAPVDYPSQFVSEGAISPGDAASYFGQISNVPLKRGQIIYASNLGGDAVDRFSELLKDGGTAVTLEVDAKKSNSHMLIPGDFVDILVLAEKSKIDPLSTKDLSKGLSTDKNKMLVPLLSKIKVLSVDRNPLASEDEKYRIPIDKEGRIPTYSYVTVGVPINDATKLALAQDLGDIVFFLRNSEDMRKVKVKTLDGLFAVYSDKNDSQDSYEYYSAKSRLVLTPTSKSDDNKNYKAKDSVDSPKLMFENTYPRIIEPASTQAN
ncbi:Flp pilus assembly protein CpaB [Cocleimonas flava]|jgi:pilus assembly protein CpaB|uniref:Flp pilus assembly protein CpaB n=2 Tax=Cocleimonas flava TaxID=634765 RepID=A0A4R1F324_9GAMM|nr:Flp pilus assembly protein CpaB [Cocleimonas flava]